MAEEQQVEPVADDDADLDAGFAGDVGKPTPDGATATGTPPADPAPEPAPEATPEPEPADPVALLKQQIADLEAKHRKDWDKAYGKVGNLETMLRQLQSQGSDIEVTEDIVADLMSDFPELGAAQLKSFQKFAEKLKGSKAAPVQPATAAAPDAAQIEALVQEQVNTRLRTSAREELAVEHEDWETVVGLPDEGGRLPDTDYRKWLAAQPKDYQDRINNSWNPRMLAKSITTFKETKKAAPPAVKPSAPSPRQERLKAAVVPRGSAGTAPEPSDQDDFEAGYRYRERAG